MKVVKGVKVMEEVSDFEEDFEEKVDAINKEVVKVDQKNNVGVVNKKVVVQTIMRIEEKQEVTVVVEVYLWWLERVLRV